MQTIISNQATSWLEQKLGKKLNWRQYKKMRRLLYAAQNGDANAAKTIQSIINGEEQRKIKRQHRLTEQQWQRILERDRPVEEINDKREYYRGEYLKSDHWRELRGRKLKANPCCQTCGIDKNLDVHHMQYKNLYDVELSDLMTLCRPCHNKVHETIDEMVRLQKESMMQGGKPRPLNSHISRKSRHPKNNSKYLLRGQTVACY